MVSAEEAALRRVLPSPEAEASVAERSRRILAEARSRAEAERPGVTAELAGSVAKGTWLDDPDVDVFLLFPEDVPKDELKRVALSVGAEMLDGMEVRYAEHPYARGRREGLSVDLVPCYRVKDASHIKSAVDRTPFHTRYVTERLDAEGRKQARLLKRFLKGVGVYGAEAKVQGASGYLSELIVLKYGTFLGAVEAMAAWKSGSAIGMSGKGKPSPGAPLTFQDPVDPGRNVASAMSASSFSLLVHACKEYLRSPSERFFFPNAREPMALDALETAWRAHGTGLLTVSLDRPDMIDDDIWPQARRTLDGLAALLEEAEFQLLGRSMAITDRVTFAFELVASSLPPVKLRNGPPAWIANADDFLAKWGDGAFLKDGRWMVLAPREFTTPGALVRERMSSAALGSGLRGLQGLDVRMDGGCLAESGRQALSALFDRRMPWDV